MTASNNLENDIAFTTLQGCGHTKVCQALADGPYRFDQYAAFNQAGEYKMALDVDGMCRSATFDVY